ncbi:MAG TPA: hypothetical protein VFB63_19530 [Bryobacteraceae bacterium]|nr:hypothetical protein [Bryobacteraceae bacterium]
MSDLDELLALLEESTLTFGEDWDLQLIVDGEKLGGWDLSAIVDALLDVADSAKERDDMIDLARLLESLAGRIRKIIADIEES